MTTKQWVPVALAAAVVGGGAGVGAVAGLGVGGDTKTTTILQQSPISSADNTRNASVGGLTARDLYKRASPGVVYVRADVVQQTQDSPFNFGIPQEQRGTSTGSGFVINKDGDILTNAHVIDGAVKVTVQLADKQTVEAKVLGKDVSSDIALLKIDPDGVNLTPLQLGSAKDVQVGDPVVAIGNPFGLDRTLTTGVVSALQRRISAPNNFQIDNVIQTDAAINPGNSGGPLIDAAGEVIGINSQIETGGSGNGNVGIGFAVPIDTAKQIVPQLEKSGKVEHAFLGVSTLTIDGSLSGLNLPVKSGALVQSVQSGSPAEGKLHAGGLSATIAGNDINLGGDIIQSVDGKPVRTADDLGTLVSSKKVGDKVTLTVLRSTGGQYGKKPITITLKLASRPNTATTDNPNSPSP